MWTIAAGVILGLLLFPLVAWALAGIFVAISTVLLGALGVLVQIVSFPFKAIQAIKESKQLQKKCLIGFGILLIFGVSVAGWVMVSRIFSDKAHTAAMAKMAEARTKAWKQPNGSRAGEQREFVIAEGVKLTLCWIPTGEFVMGSSKVIGDATPQNVKIARGFWLSQTEVTQAQWRAMMGNNPSHFKGDDLPVESVSWNDICGDEERTGGFLGKLNQLQPSGGRFDLPTQAQWEYACRAGSTAKDDGDLNANAWFKDNSGRKTHPVGQTQANAWGLHDMLGNIWEWCADTTYSAGFASGSLRGFKGGSWDYEAQYYYSVATSFSSYPVSTSTDIGFRVARSSVPSR